MHLTCRPHQICWFRQAGCSRILPIQAVCIHDFSHSNLHVRHRSKTLKPFQDIHPVFSDALDQAHSAFAHLSRLALHLVCRGLDISPELSQQLAHLVREDEEIECDVGPDVLRLYRIWRSSQSKLPGVMGAATSIHSDMGLLTLAPVSNFPWLRILEPRCRFWISAEASGEVIPTLDILVFPGETLAYITRGQLKAPLHYVEEEMVGSDARFSMPFFLRGWPDAALPQMPAEASHSDSAAVVHSTVRGLIENEVWPDRVYNYNKRKSTIRTDY